LVSLFSGVFSRLKTSKNVTRKGEKINKSKRKGENKVNHKKSNKNKEKKKKQGKGGFFRRVCDTKERKDYFYLFFS